MSTPNRTLDPLAIPLQGVHLIEASAGTGKTHAITGLYLRLLLQRGLEVDRILVVTFTNAATEELRDRIRLRIRRLLRALQGDEEVDSELQGYIALIEQPEQAIQRLRDALIRLDEAAVFTIHGYCRRVLSENALESGTLFETEFIAGDKALEQAVVEDYWRRCIQNRGRAAAEWIRSRWSGPDALHHGMRDLLRRGDGRVYLNPGDFERHIIESENDFSLLAQAWSDARDPVMELLLAADGLTQDKSKGYTQERLGDASAALDTWFEGGFSLVPPKALTLFSSATLAERTKKNKQTPQHPFFDQCRDYLEQSDDSERRLHALLLQEARDWCLRELESRKSRSRELSFDDLLQRLDTALMSAGGGLLAQRLRQRCPVALIDEFQDTDPRQYRIFSAIYRHADAQPDEPPSGLFMIGDPKQAIYSFRGADVFTYIGARRDTPAQSRYTLDTNWRSSEQLVTAVNRLFSRSPAPFIFDDIPFEPMRAAGMADLTPLTVDGGTEAPLKFWFLTRQGKERVIAKNRAEPLIAEACAHEVARLLQLGEQGRALIGGRAVEPGDIALLVRSRVEAAKIRDALFRVGVGSVIQSRDSVFDSEEARETALLLQAVAMPTGESGLRAAAATSLLGAGAADLHHLGESAEAWDRLHETFGRYRRLWLEHGFMAMFMRLLHDNAVPSRLLARMSGERRLTNLLHLAELLQSASRQQESPERLMRWFADQRRHADGDSEEQMLCLESDERLVRIVTIHKSKGLQYPVVFLPFLFRGREQGKEPPLACHDRDSGELLFDLGSDQFSRHWQWAEQERLAEDARLAYVALTRAEHRCYLPWGAIRGYEQGMLGQLLFPDGCGDDGEMLDGLKALDSGDGAVSVEPLPEDSLTALDGGAESLDASSLHARAFSTTIERNRRVTSYSGLVAGLEQPAAERLAEAEGTTEEGDRVGDFPAGTVPGLFLHTLLENLSFPDAEGDTLGNEVERCLDLYGLDRCHAPAARRLVANLLDTPLDGGALKLRDLSAERRLNEMAFHFPIDHLSAEGLNAVLERFGGDRQRRLNFPAVSGLMKGFIDLIFEYDGRYYLADYKSNLLGVSQEDYGATALKAAMQGHRYDLQYLIYTVALHRYLAGRLPGYDYERHFGGVYYLFPRGMSPRQGNRYGVYYDLPDFAQIDALGRLFGGRP